MTVDVSTRIYIERPCGLVASYAADPGNAPTWYVNIKSAEWRTKPPLAVGSRIAFVARFLGRRMDYTYEVMAYIPGQRLVMSTHEGPFPMETTYIWEDIGETRTRMTLRNRGEPTGFFRFMAPLMATAMQRANEKDLARLKQLLEQEHGSAG